MKTEEQRQDEAINLIRRAHRQGMIELGILFFSIFVLGLVFSYLLATVGHPTAYWTWHNILGVL